MVIISRIVIPRIRVYSIIGLFALYFLPSLFLRGSNELPPNPAELLVDVSVTNPSPAYSDIFQYKIRYRYASTTEHGTNAQIQFTFPDAYEIVSIPLLGGNVSSISNSGNQYTVTLASSFFPGVPPGGLAAGSSGLFEFNVKFLCGVNGSGVIPIAGSTVNLIQNPIFTVSGVSNTAIAPALVTVPVVDACPPPPTSSGSTIFEKRNDMNDFIGADMIFRYFLDIPAHSSSYVFTDDFPDELKLVAGMSTQQDGWFSSNFATIEVQATNGTWYDITSHNSIYDWIHAVAEGASLIDGSSIPIPGTSRVDVDIPNSYYTPPDPDVPFTADYAEGIVAIRLTTVAGGIATNGSYAMHMYIPPSTIAGVYQNCFTTSDPIYPTPDCDDITIVDKGSLSLSCGNLNNQYGLGGTSVAIFVENLYPTIYTKDPLDIQGWFWVVSRAKTTLIESITLEVLLETGFDFVDVGDSPNYWIVHASELLEVNDSSALVPVFTKIPDYNGTGKVLLRWEFPNLIYPTNQRYQKGTGKYILNSPLYLYYSAKYTKAVALPVTGTFDHELKTGTVMSDWASGTPSQNETCSTSTNFPTAGGTIESEKYALGALDTEKSQYPVFGNTDLSGDATYELYIYNKNFENVKQLDIADILPYIGDQEMLGTTSRGSGWSEELANAIIVERYKIGSGLIDASSNIPNGVLYSNTYNACYLDGALPAGQVTADMANANTGQSAGCTDFSSSVAAAGAKGFAFRWLNTGDPLIFGEYLKITVNVQQLTGEVDMTNNEVAWSSFAYTAIQADDDVFFSSEPLKVGVRMIDVSNSATFCGTVWEDENGDGQRGGGEPLIKDVMVYLYDAAQNSITESVTFGGVTSNIHTSTLTDSMGHYCFYGLNPNTNYYVRLERESDFLPSNPLYNFILTTPNATSSDNDDSDAILGTLTGSSTTPYPLIATSTNGLGSVTDYYDFGFYAFSNVGNYVWYDDDGAGDQDLSESPTSGVTLTLKKWDGTTIFTEITDINGSYLFDKVPPGEYYIEASNLPVGKIPTTKQTTGNDNNDSDFSDATIIKTDNFFLFSGESQGMKDLGLKDDVINPASICGRTWDDIDEDGVLDAGEPRQPNVNIQLLDVNGFVLTTTISDDNGDYCFNNLIPNIIYKVGFVLSSPTSSSFTNSGIDMDANTSTGVTGNYSPTDNQNITNVDAGFVGPFSIGNLVWSDSNKNGTYDIGESGFSNVKVYLLDGVTSNILDSTITDGNGKYLFKNLVQNSYRVKLELPSNVITTIDIGTSATPNSVDNDENGVVTPSSGQIQSELIVLELGGGSNAGANWSETDHGDIINSENDPASNAKAYYTVDFGLIIIVDEICNNGIDDDGDGLIDCFDCADCFSSGSCADNDGDGIGDYCDLDDDNDGILDTDECNFVSTGFDAYWTSNTDGLAALHNNSYNTGILSNVNSPMGLGSGATYNINSPAGSTAIWVDSGSDQTSLAGAKADNDYVEMEFTTESTLDYIALTRFDYLLYVLQSDPTVVVSGAYDYTMEISSDNFATSDVLTSGRYGVVGNSDLVTLTGPNGVTVFDFVGYYRSLDYVLSPGTTYKIRFYFYNDEEGNGEIIIDDLGLGFTVTTCDTDDDGIPDYLDLDADNDGIFDVVEAGGTDADADGIADGAIDPLTGIPSSAGAGITPIATTGGTFDFQNTDSDGDGCSDANEAYNDANADNGDGEQYGAGTPAPNDADGTVTAAAYNTGITQVAEVVDGDFTASVCFIDPCDPIASGNTDTDNDGISDICDTDDDNDGILDTDECALNTDITFATLLAGGTVTVDGIDITVSTTGSINSFTTDGQLASGAHMKPGLFTPINTATITINFSQPIGAFSTTFEAQQDEEMITFSEAATSVENFLNSTYGNYPPIMSQATLENGGLELRSNLTDPPGSSASAFGSNSQVNWIFPTPIMSLTITHIGVDRGNPIGVTNFNGTIIGGAFLFCVDTDSDGIADYLDLDSDADGCPDAIEGAGNFTSGDLVTSSLNGGSTGVQDNLGIGADTDGDGLLNIVEPNGQGVGDSQNAAVNACIDACDATASGNLDSDGDNVSNICDLDDDNDGILDRDEYDCSSSVTPFLGWEHNALPKEQGFNDVPLWIAAVDDETFGPGIGASYNGSLIEMTGVDQSSLFDAIADGDFIAGGFMTQAGINAATIQEFWHTKHPSPVVSSDSYGYSVAILISTDNFTTYQQLTSDDIDTTIPGSFTAEMIGTIEDNNYVVSPSTQYDIRVYFFNKTTSAAVPAAFDDLVLRFSTCNGVADADNDGMPNHLDLDSDNDGIFDLDEAGHSAIDSNNDGVIDGAAALFGANGFFDAIETLVDNGTLNYTISDSESTPDGTYDAYELDSDEDGCNDTDEEGISDTDSDGLAGTGAPTVDANGLVTSITYASPSNNFWQNPLSGVCLAEICGDGIDNNADGFDGFIDIINITTGNCFELGGQSLATIDVEVSWVNTIGTENVIVDINGNQQIINVGSSTSPTTVQIDITADGSLNNLVGAYFETTTTCKDSIYIEAPISCLSPACAGANPMNAKTYNIWHTGSGGGLDFSQMQTSGALAGYPSTFTQTGAVSNMTKREGGATYCHPISGEVLIYSDGEKGWDAAGNEYTTSDVSNRFNTLATNLSSAAGTPLIIASPGQCDMANELYIFFTDDHIGAASELYYAIIDVPNKTISNPVQLSIGATSEQINAVQVNCDTIWIVYRNQKDINSIRWTTAGFEIPVVSANIHTSTDQRYRSAFSMDATRFAATIAANPDTLINQITVCDFDYQTGQFSNPFSLQPFRAVPDGSNLHQNYGVVFSPDGSKLYTNVSTGGGGKSYLLQYNLDAVTPAAINSSMITIDSITESGNGFGGMMNAPDGRIYISAGDGSNDGIDSLHVLDFPNLLGAASGFQANVIAPGGATGSGLNNIVYGLGPAACIPTVAIEIGVDSCSEILLTVDDCYFGSGGPYDIYFTIDGSLDSVMNQTPIAREITLSGFSPGKYTDIFIVDVKGCASVMDSIILAGTTCTEICNNGFDDDLDGDIDLADSECACSVTAQNPIWVVDEETGVNNLRLWSYSDYTDPNTGVDYGRLQYFDPSTSTVRDADDASDMESMAINTYTGIAYFMSANKSNNGPASSQALFQYDLNEAANNQGSIVLTLLGHIAKPSGKPMEALAFDAVNNRFYTSDPVDINNSGSVVPAELYYIDISALNANPLIATMPVQIGTMSGLGETCNYVDGLEFGDNDKLYAIDGTDGHLYEIDLATGVILAIIDNDLAGGTGHGSVDIETISWDAGTQKMIAVDNDHEEFIQLDLTSNGNNTVLMNYLSTAGMPSNADMEGSAMFDVCQPKMVIGNLIFKDNNSNGSYDSGEGLDGVVVELYQSGTNVSTASPLNTVSTSGGGFYIFENLIEGSYFIHIPAGEFGSGATLEYLISTTGSGGDNQADNDDNGVDVVAPWISGVSSDIITLTEDLEPINGSSEAGVGNTSDDSDDDNGDLTVDFAFITGTEICNDGIDNDGDGLTDCDDPNCDPIANPAILNTCDNSNGAGSGTFFLHDANPTVSIEMGLMISYHPTLLDAQNDTNVLLSPYTSSSTTIYVRVERITTGCYATAVITLIVGAKCAENCNNNIDEDGDGLIDCDDPDCPCCDAIAPTLIDLNKN